MIDQNAGEKTLILQASSPAVSDTLFDSSQAQRLQNQSVYAEVVCRLTLQRHFSVLTKFARVESRLSGRKRRREAIFYTPVNLCDRRACSASVAVGLYT